MIVTAGPGHLTSRAVTQQAGVATGLLFKHFRNFDDFLIGYAVDRTFQLTTTLTGLPALVGTGTVATNLSDMIHTTPMITLHTHPPARRQTGTHRDPRGLTSSSGGDCLLSTGMSVVVIGAGVIGLTVAHELAVAGHRVRVVADRDAAHSVSAVAAAIWFPHAVTLESDVLESGRVGYERLARLAETAGTGVVMRPGLVRVRRAGADLSWTDAVPGYERVADGVRCRVPVADTSHYLAWLTARVAALGVEFTVATVRPAEPGPDALVEAVARIGGEEPDTVVVAAGLGSGALLGDGETYPIRGQVVRLANPGLTEWITDEDNPGGLTYVVPRSGDVVCGGTGQAGDWNETVDPGAEEAILRRVYALVPELRGQPVLSRAVGLRPARTRRSLERTGRVVTCYGHGGSGFTLSWGDAARVADLLAA
ncbi:hypothetical protein GCM10009828_054220 [Actinoplanes couchii]|uniref:D-amino-acid oxidase n=1 Tax=Actinoplanes couchii TaxID=403638 RepID=A0ABQ3XQN7_9ACTN|nr:hypothetical protein Aco03nite_092270 [Actinoplanes couchii]